MLPWSQLELGTTALVLWLWASYSASTVHQSSPFIKRRWPWYLLHRAVQLKWLAACKMLKKYLTHVNCYCFLGSQTNYKRKSYFLFTISRNLSETCMYLPKKEHTRVEPRGLYSQWKTTVRLLLPVFVYSSDAHTEHVWNIIP